MPELLDRWTRADVVALPDDGNRYELVDGALLVTPSPRYRHQAAVRVLVGMLHSWVRSRGIGSVDLAPCDLDLRSDQLVQPDLFVHAHPKGRPPGEWNDIGIPLVVVEILSPSTARSDRHIKRRLYQRVGVSEYWIVDLDAEVVERWRPADERPEILADQLVWSPDGVADALRIDLPTLFREIQGGGGNCNNVSRK